MTREGHQFLFALWRRVPISGYALQTDMDAAEAAIATAQTDIDAAEADIDAIEALLPGYALLAGGNSFTGAQAVAFQELTDAASIAMDASLSNNYAVTLAGDRTLANPTNPRDGAYYNVWVTQGSGGPHTLAYGDKFIFPDSEAPVLSTAEGALDILTFQYRQAIDKYALVAVKSFGA